MPKHLKAQKIAAIIRLKGRQLAGDRRWTDKAIAARLHCDETSVRRHWHMHLTGEKKKRMGPAPGTRWKQKRGSKKVAEKENSPTKEATIEVPKAVAIRSGKKRRISSKKEKMPVIQRGNNEVTPLASEVSGASISDEHAETSSSSSFSNSEDNTSIIMKRLQEILGVSVAEEAGNENDVGGSLIDSVLRLKKRAEELENFKNGVQRLATNLGFALPASSNPATTTLPPPTSPSPPIFVQGDQTLFQNVAAENVEWHQRNKNNGAFALNNSLHNNSLPLSPQQETTSSAVAAPSTSDEPANRMKSFLNTMWQAVVRSNELPSSSGKQ